MTKRGTGKWVGLLAGVLVAGTAHAGGVFLYEVGTSDVGYASAGWAARADAPVTILTNPAGMTRLDGIQVQVAGELLYANLTFAPNSSTTVSGTNGGNAVGFLPNGSVFATFAPWNDFRVGFGFASNFGLAAKWEDDWVGRYYTTQSALLGLSILPSVAWHVAGGLSVGVTFNAMYGYLKDVVAIPNLEPNAADGALGIQSSTWGFGANVGLMYEFSKGSRIGITYTSPVSLSFAATPNFHGLGPLLAQKLGGLTTANINAGLTVPQTVMLSFFQAITEQWAVMGDVGWQNWAAFGTVELGVSNTDTSHSLTTNIGYLNTWHGALGAQVQLSEPWQLDFGVAYDSTMTNDQNRSLSLPIGDAWRFGVGTKWTLNANWTFGLSYEFLWGGNPSVDVSRIPSRVVSGTYANTWFNFIAFNFIWKGG
ncbi:MAG: OmpP1/FadL family transporter [Myxococcaceae bacterium]